MSTIPNKHDAFDKNWMCTIWSLEQVWNHKKKKNNKNYTANTIFFSSNKRLSLLRHEKMMEERICAALRNEKQPSGEVLIRKTSCKVFCGFRPWDIFILVTIEMQIFWYQKLIFVCQKIYTTGLGLTKNIYGWVTLFADYYSLRHAPLGP